MRTKYFTITLFALFLISSVNFGQTDKSVNEKVKNIKGDVQKITISTNEGNIIFEGDDAKALFQKLKEKEIKKRVKVITGNDEIIEIDGDHKIIKNLGDDDDVLIFISEDGDADMLEGGKTINVNVEENDGNKKVTVTTVEDGEKKVEIYEGEEAETYLKEHKAGSDLKFEFEVDDDSPNKLHKNLWIHKNKSDNNLEKKVKVEIEDGVKKVTVTTTENGEEKVETFTGKDADKYLEKMDKEDDGIKVLKWKQEDGKMKKKIIIEEIDKEDRN